MKQNISHDEENANLHQLLQLKRLETPGPEYFEHFLTEFHRYQRASLIEKPSFKTRLVGSFESIVSLLSVKPMAYSSAFAAAIVVAFFVTSSMTETKNSSSTSFAANQTQTGYYGNQYHQQPELYKPVSYKSEKNSTHYVTGETATPYEKNIVF